jgi:hypothetical protein
LLLILGRMFCRSIAIITSEIVFGLETISSSEAAPQTNEMYG